MTPNRSRSRAPVSRGGLLVLAASLALPAAVARGQLPQQGPEPIRSGDRGPLDVDLEAISRGLDVPSGFDAVYAVPGFERLRMRIDGALYAVFTESEYVDTPYGALPLVPSTTAYFIGPPDPAILALRYGAGAGPGGRAGAGAIDPNAPRRLLPYADPGRVATRLEARFDRDLMQVPEGGRMVTFSPGIDEARTAPPPPDEGTPGSTMVTDERYRAARIRVLLQRAAAEDRPGR